MDKAIAKQQFQEADVLYRQGRYDESLAILGELNREFPNQKHIMLAAAKSMEKLGMIEEAKLLCHQMIRAFDYGKAHRLLDYLEVAPRIAQQIANEIDWEDAPQPAAQTPHRQPYPSTSNDEDNRLLKLGIVVAVNVVALLLLYMPSQLGIAGGAAIVMTLFSLIAAILIFHFSWSYVFKRICENADTEPGILIWVPLLSIIPIMRAARMRFLWLLTLLAPFVLAGGMVIFALSKGTTDVSSVGIHGALFAFSVLLNLLFFAFFCFISFFFVLYIKLSEECGKPAWLGVLLLWQPWGALALPCYLAFSQPESLKGFQSVGAKSGTGRSMPGQAQSEKLSGVNVGLLLGGVALLLIVLALPLLFAGGREQEDHFSEPSSQSLSQAFSDFFGQRVTVGGFATENIHHPVESPAPTMTTGAGRADSTPPLPALNPQTLVGTEWLIMWRNNPLKITVAYGGTLYITFPQAQEMTGQDYVQGRWTLLAANTIRFEASIGEHFFLQELTMHGNDLLQPNGNKVSRI